MTQIAQVIKKNKKNMKKRGIILLIGISIFLFAGIGIYATTRITDNQITAQNFNMSGGRFNQGADILSEVGFIKDDSVGGKASYISDPRKSFIYGKYAYLVSSTEDTLTILDISDPTNITEVGYIRDDSQGGSATALDGATGIIVSGKYAYVTSKTDDALSIFDVSNPANITEIGYIQDDSHVGGKASCLDGAGLSDALYVSGKYAYVLVSGTEYAFSVFDISDPTNITEINCIRDDLVGGKATMLALPRSFVIEGKYAYIISMYKESQNKGNNSLSIFDISDPTNITEVGYIQDDSNGGTATAMSGPRGIVVSGKYAYVVSNVDHSLTIIDISNKSNPVQVNYIQDDSLGGDASYLDGANFIVKARNYVFVTSNGLNPLYDDSLCVFDVSNPYDIKEVKCVLDEFFGGSFSGLHDITSLTLNSNKLYVSSSANNSLSIIQISGIDTPSVKTGTLETTILDVFGNLRVLRDVYLGNGLNVAGTGLFSAGLSVKGLLKVIGNLEITGNYTNNNKTGITGNYTNGNCWTAYSGGIIYDTNCTSN